MNRFPTYLSAKCVIATSQIDGKGVIAKRNIPKGEIISIWGGGIFRTKDLKKISRYRPHLFSHSIGVSEGFHLAVLNMNKGLDDCDRFNHSCNPNIGVKGQIIIVSRRNIKKGEELCFDYETTEVKGCGGLPFNCKCGDKNCRKTIDGNAWKDKKFQKENEGYFSWYIQEKINTKSKRSSR